MEKGFLEQKYADLHNSPEVKSAVERQEGRTGRKIANNPEAKINIYLNRLEEIFNHPDEETRKRRIEIYKEKILYPTLGVTYSKDVNRLQIKYVKQVEGIVCSGGICRLEPAFSGVRFTLSSQL